MVGKTDVVLFKSTTSQIAILLDTIFLDKVVYTSIILIRAFVWLAYPFTI